MYDADYAPFTAFINCVADTATGNYYGFWSEGEQSGTHEVTFSNCFVINTYGGFGVSENVYAIIENCVVDNTSNRGIWFHGGSGKVSNTILRSCGETNSDSYYSPIHIDTAGSVIIANCRFQETSSSFDVYLYNSNQIEGPYIIEGNYFTKGIRLSNGSTTKSIVVSNNTFESCSISNYNYIYNVVIDGNLFIDGGVVLFNAYDVVVADNVFRDNGSSDIAINIQTDSLRICVRDNLINGYNNGIRLYGGVGYTTVVGNAIYNYRGSSVYYEVWTGPGKNYIEGNYTNS